MAKKKTKAAAKAPKQLSRAIGATTMNADLDDLRDMLATQNEALFAKLGTTTDPDVADALVVEMQELTHRINVVQTLLFKAQSDAISSAVASVRSANNQLSAALNQLTNLTNFLQTITAFLALVDQAIDVAKLVI